MKSKYQSSKSKKKKGLEVKAGIISIDEDGFTIEVENKTGKDVPIVVYKVEKKGDLSDSKSR